MNLEMPEKIFGIDSSIVKISALPIALVLGMAFSLIFVLSSKIPEIQSQMKKVDTLVSGRKQYESKKTYLMNVDQESIAKDGEYLEMAMLQNKDAYLLVNVIRNVIAKFDYSIDSFSISPGQVAADEAVVATTTKSTKKKVSAKDNDLVRIPVNLVMVGPRDKYMDVVEALETTLPILSIGKMDFKSDYTVGTISMTVTSYFSTDKTDIKIASLTINDLTLSAEESELIKNISQYSKIDNAGGAGLIDSQGFNDYNRNNPFSF